MKIVRYGFGLGLIALFVGALTSQAFAILPEKSPTAERVPTTPPTPLPPNRDSVPVTCTIKYVHGDVAYAPPAAQKCSTLVSVVTSSGTYNYPVSCTTKPRESSCAAKLVFQNGRYILPPDSKIVSVQTFAEKIYGQNEQALGCVYADGKVLTSPLFDQSRKFYGVNTYHLLYCEKPPMVVSTPLPTVQGKPRNQ